MRTIVRTVLRLMVIAFAAMVLFEGMYPRIFKTGQADNNVNATEAIAQSYVAGQNTKIEINTVSSEFDCEEETPGILRLHVVANSDGDEDQRVKLLVRDALIEQFSPSSSLKDAEQLLILHGDEIQNTVEDVLSEQGCGYGAQLRVGLMDFPEREYNGEVFPAGEYEALRVELGEAKGQNWWCVLFPPLCLVDSSVTELDYTDELIFESDIIAYLKKLKNNG